MDGAVEEATRGEGPPVGLITLQPATLAAHIMIAASRRPSMLARTYQTMYLGLWSAFDFMITVYITRLGVA